MKKRLYAILILLIITVDTPLSAQQLTFYMIPSPKKINWESPNKLFRSVVLNFTSKNPTKFPKRSISHIIVELAKDGDTILTAMTSDRQSDFFKSFLLHGRGMSLLFDIYPGHLEQREELRPEIDYFAEKGELAYIRYLINDSTFYFFKNYVDSFSYYGLDKYYNGANNPLEEKGAGCSAFAISFLELINAFDSTLISEWATQINIPNRLIGHSNWRGKVHPLRVVFSFNWAKKNEEYKPLFLFNPQLMYNWVQKESKNTNKKIKRISFKKAKGIEFDYTLNLNPTRDYYFIKSSNLDLTTPQ